MDIIAQGILPDGRPFEVLRVITPDEKVPEELVRYFISSMGFDHYRTAIYGLALWRTYFRDSLSGVYAAKVVDYHYVIKISGHYAGRLWFAYNRQTRRGNFGNVYTEEAYRHQGLMTILLHHFKQDFMVSPAELLCCSSTNPIAVQSYLKSGFKLIHGGTGGPLALCKNSTFQNLEKKLFLPNDRTRIRPGHIGDQFECDKVLAYSTPVWSQRTKKKYNLAVLLNSYQMAYVESTNGNGVINVLENSAGAVPGFAFALNFFGQSLLDFQFHPWYAAPMPDLLERCVQQYEAQYHERPICTVNVDDALRRDIVQKAHLQQVGGQFGQYDLFQ